MGRLHHRTDPIPPILRIHANSPLARVYSTVSFNNLESGRTCQVWVRAQSEAGMGERGHASITVPE